MKVLKKSHQLFFLTTCTYSILYTMALHGACTKTIKSTLRKGPGVQFEKLWDITLFSPVKVKKYKDQWVQIEDSEGIPAWIPRSDITREYFCGSIKFEKVAIEHLIKNKESPKNSKPAERGLAFFDQNFKILNFKKGQVAAQSPLGNQVLVPRKSLWVQ